MLVVNKRKEGVVNCALKIIFLLLVGNSAEEGRKCFYLSVQFIYGYMALDI